MADDTIDVRQSTRFVVPTLLLCCGAMLIYCGLDIRGLHAWLGRAGPWAPIAFALAGVLSMTAFVPKTIVSISAGALFGTPLGSLLMLVVAVSAAALNYSIARWWLFDSIGRRLHDTKQQHGTRWLRAVRNVAADAGFQFHLVVRLTPIPTTLISYTMGANGSRVRPFLLAAAVAVIPQMLWVHGGTAATMIDDPNVPGLRWVGVVVSVLAAVAIGVIVPREASKRLQREKVLDPSGATD